MRYNTLRITTFIISYGTLILILLASGSLTSSGSHHLTNFNSGNLQEIPSKNNLMTRNSVSQIDGESYDFDIEYAFKYVDYTWLIEDPINVNRFFQDVLKRLDLGQFEEAEVLVKTKIDEYCKYYTTYGKSKFNDNDQECREAFETVRGLRPMTDNTFNDCIYAKLIQIHALTLELKGDYSEATAAYQLVFGANKKLCNISAKSSRQIASDSH